MSSHAFHRLFFHFVWSVKNRLSLLDETSHSAVVETVRTACEERGAQVLACNAMPDHVHLFVRLPPTLAPATFIGQVKGAASFAHNRKFGNRKFLKWQDGYGVVSVREGEVAKVVRYIEDQQMIHAARKTSQFLEATFDEAKQAASPAAEAAGYEEKAP